MFHLVSTIVTPRFVFVFLFRCYILSIIPIPIQFGNKKNYEKIVQNTFSMQKEGSLRNIIYGGGRSTHLRQIAHAEIDF
jgi:hypothetical protein